MAFHVGMRVVCVDASGARCLQHQAVYTVTGLTSDMLAVDACCRCGHPGAGHWWQKRFRPLADRESSIFFTMGADPESEKWDGRRKQKERV